MQMKSKHHPRFHLARLPESPWLAGTELVWHPDEVETHFEQPRNSFCYFRKAFRLQGDTAKASLKIFADSRYKLYVNGHYISRGPCRSDPRWQYYDVIDIAAKLLPGRNVIAVLALHYGYNTGHYLHRIPALVVQADILGADGKTATIGTDSTWRCCKAEAFDSRAPRVNGCQGPMEVFDSRKAAPGWESPDYDDGEWTAAKGRDTQLSPFYNWLPRPIPMMEEGRRTADRAVNRGWVEERPQEIQQLHHHQLMAEEDSLQVWPVGEAGPDYTVDPAVPGRASVITFDFGAIEAGYLQLEATGADGTIIDAVYAEELWEGKAYLNLNNNRSADRFILRGGFHTLEVAMGWKAFRYVQLRIRNASAPVTFHRVGMRTRRYPLEREARFSCNEERVNSIWQISARTLRLCMQDGFLDSPSREQQQWMGDGRWQAIINAYYSGDSRLHRKLLEQIGQSQDSKGMTKSRYPDGHENRPPIPSFCLAWISSFNDYCRYTGDEAFAGSWWPNIVLALRWFSGYENADGLLEDVPYWMFIDRAEWPEGPIPDDLRGGVIAGLNLQYLEALRIAAEFAVRFEDAEAAGVYRQKIKAVSAGIRSQLWQEKRGAYADCLVDGMLSPSVSEATNALALLHLHDPEEERAVRIMDSVFLGKAAYRVTAGSPYFMLPIFRALIRMNAVGKAVVLMSKRYGVMLEAGSGTVWEGWTLFHKREGSSKVSFSSASHAWGASPIVLLVEGVLGFSWKQPGCAAFSFNPRLCGLTYVKASLPAAGGMIHMEVMEDGQSAVMVSVDIPPGGSGEIGGTVFPPGKHKVRLFR